MLKTRVRTGWILAMAAVGALGLLFAAGVDAQRAEERPAVQQLVVENGSCSATSRTGAPCNELEALLLEEGPACDAFDLFCDTWCFGSTYFSYCTEDNGVITRALCQCLFAY